MEYLNELNSEQKLAVTSHEPYFRVIAGAGSGKTKVLTHRIAYLINELGIPDKTILAITFTNKAANEMKERVTKLLEVGMCKSTISTFHSFCAKFLREDIRVLGYPSSFTILDEDDQVKVIKKLAKEDDDDSLEEKIKPKEYLSYISFQKDKEISPAEALKNAEGFYGEKAKAKMYEAYEEYLTKNHYLDFDDLILKTVKILEENPNIREKWQHRITNILVDEFQDTNNIQYRLIKLLMTKDTALFVVGDPDQTIYTWRGANVDIIMNFKKDFRGTQDVVLNTNYRSTPNILSCANALISHNKDRVPKDLITNNPEGGKVLYCAAPSVSQEAEWVCERMLELVHKNNKISYKDFAILYRSTYYSRAMEQTLIKHGIPYVVYGSLKFYDRKEVKDSLCYLRLVTNDMDDIAFERVINEPKRGFGDKSLEEVRNIAREKQTSLYNALKDSDLKIGQTLAITSFIGGIERAKKAIKDHQLTYSDVLQNLLDEVGYVKAIQEKKEHERLENINELKLSLDEKQKDDPSKSLVDILQDVALYAAQDEVDEERQNIPLMTIHTAKGLEFPYVFVIGLSEGVLPNMRALQESKKGIEEERRLAYVAFTRAKKQLFLSSAGGYNYSFGGEQSGSRFLEEAGEFITSYYKTSLAEANLRPAKKIIPKRSINAIPPNKENWHPGDMLLHTVFGEGIVIAMDSDTLTVAFKNSKVGQKIISINFGGIKHI